MLNNVKKTFTGIKLLNFIKYGPCRIFESFRGSQGSLNFKEIDLNKSLGQNK